MASFNQLILLVLFLVFGCALTQVPAILVITFTHKNFSMIASASYWIANAASALPSMLGIGDLFGDLSAAQGAQ